MLKKSIIIALVAIFAVVAAPTAQAQNVDPNSTSYKVRHAAETVAKEAFVNTKKLLGGIKAAFKKNQQRKAQQKIQAQRDAEARAFLRQYCKESPAKCPPGFK